MATKPQAASNTASSMPGMFKRAGMALVASFHVLRKDKSLFYALLSLPGYALGFIERDPRVQKAINGGYRTFSEVNQAFKPSPGN